MLKKSLIDSRADYKFRTVRGFEMSEYPVYPNFTFIILLFGAFGFFSLGSIGVCMMFGFSALYHRVDWRSRVLIIMRRLDHSAIFVMIAGSFTPICLLVLPGNTGIQLLFIIWIIAGIGILQTVLFTETPRLIRAGIYLVAGYMAIPYLSVMFSVMSMTNFTLTAAGGTIYTVGAIGYGFKFPDISPKYFGYHEFFHILVAIAAVLHFIVIYSIVG